MPLRAYAQMLLFDPLGIKRLTFDDDRSNLIAHRVFSYEADPHRPFGYKQHLGNANTVGDGGMYGCTADLLRWEADWHRQWTDKSVCCTPCWQRRLSGMDRFPITASAWKSCKGKGTISFSIAGACGDLTR
jgi:hypothetical protein